MNSRIFEGKARSLEEIYLCIYRSLFKWISIRLEHVDKECHSVWCEELYCLVLLVGLLVSSFVCFFVWLFIALMRVCFVFVVVIAFFFFSLFNKTRSVYCIKNGVIHVRVDMPLCNKGMFVNTRRYILCYFYIWDKICERVSYTLHMYSIFSPISSS